MAGLKFSSFGAATMPLSKIVVDTDLGLAPYNANIGDVVAENITAATLDTTDISCRDIFSRQVETYAIAVPSDTVKKAYPDTFGTYLTSWQTAKIIPIPTGYTSPSSVRVKFTLTPSYYSVKAYGRVMCGTYTSPEYVTPAGSAATFSADVPIDDGTTITIQIRSSAQGYTVTIQDISISCDHQIAIRPKSIKWV